MSAADHHVIWLGLAGLLGVLSYGLGYSQRAMERLARRRRRRK